MMLAHATATNDPGAERRQGGAPDRALTRALKVLALVALATYCLYAAAGILVPLAFAALVAMLASPLVARLSRVVPRGLAIAAVTLALSATLGGTIALIGNQVADFAAEWPAIQERGVELAERAIDRVAGVLGISEASVERRLGERIDASGAGAADALSRFAGSLGGFLGDVLLFFVYLVLLLASESRLRTFVLAKAAPHQRREAAAALDDVRAVAGEYLRGRLLLIGVLFGVYVAGFLWAGLEFATVVAAIAALMSFVPYVGNLAAAALVVLVAAVGGGDFASVTLWCLGTMAVAQVLESYVLTPLVVGKGVDLNPLATVLAVVAMGTIWGLGGAVLAIPVVAILRQVLAHLRRGREWAYLLSDSRADDLGIATPPAV